MNGSGNGADTYGAIPEPSTTPLVTLSTSGFSNLTTAALIAEIVSKGSVSSSGTVLVGYDVAAKIG